MKKKDNMNGGCYYLIPNELQIILKIKKKSKDKCTARWTNH